MTYEEAIRQLEQKFKWTLDMSEVFKSVFYGGLCLTVGHYYILASEGNERLEIVFWLSRN